VATTTWSGFANALGRPRLHEEEQAVEADLLVSMEEAQARPELLTFREQRDVQHAIGQGSIAHQVGHQVVVTWPPVLRGQDVVVRGDHPVRVTHSHHSNAVASRAELLDHAIRHARLISEHEPLDRPADGIVDRLRLPDGLPIPLLWR